MAMVPIVPVTLRRCGPVAPGPKRHLPPQLRVSNRKIPKGEATIGREIPPLSR